MGSALVAGILRAKFVDPARITVCDPSEDQLKKLVHAHQIKTSCSNEENIPDANWILLAVKPQHMTSLLTNIQPHLNPSQLVISIAAGISTKTIVSALRHDRVVRVMPNMPAQVGCGMSAWVATEAVNAGDRALLTEFLKTFGDEVELQSDDEIDKATALHGSGPGYFFFITEALMHAGMELGFSEDVARRLAVQTAYGSGVLAKETGTDPGTLRTQVTSKGGGTEAALNSFADEKVREGFIKGIHAAYKRYQELSKQ